VFSNAGIGSEQITNPYKSISSFKELEAGKTDEAKADLKRLEEAQAASIT